LQPEFFRTIKSHAIWIFLQLFVLDTFLFDLEKIAEDLPNETQELPPQNQK